MTTHQEMYNLPKKYKPIIVEDEYRNSIKASDQYEDPDELVEKEISEMLEEWMSKHKQSLSKKAFGEMEIIIEQSKTFW